MPAAAAETSALSLPDSPFGHIRLARCRLCAGGESHANIRFCRRHSATLHGQGSQARSQGARIRTPRVISAWRTVPASTPRHVPTLLRDWPCSYRRTAVPT